MLAGAGGRGWELFREDEDRFGLREVLQASSFDESGRAWVAPAAWELSAGFVGSGGGAGSGGRGAAGAACGATTAGTWVTEEARLPAGARALLESMRAASAAEDEPKQEE